LAVAGVWNHLGGFLRAKTASLAAGIAEAFAVHDEPDYLISMVGFFRSRPSLFGHYKGLRQDRALAATEH